MEATSRRTRWKNAFIYGIVTTVMLLSSVVLLSALTQQSQRDLAARVDRNAQIARAGVDSIVCILAIEPENRTNKEIQACMNDHGYSQFYTSALPNQP